ncbi:DUF4129 domain-containing transglutaminase family protein [Alkaliphilus peptidifermentans]|uniref:Transglutaminase-like domain-containing protein n=1 Tax=Alkaliphilus peptidifermentans DSM 18978 TaxID=1120976 RepID=A0A1G5AM59_9FIRM|nr:transglutaminase domain-containing protein [Alkaliphilus peptidifermentans]SCX78967.1 protein of unknown function [Alkaliphilus peptidifermentans DSM 18978]
MKKELNVNQKFNYTLVYLLMVFTLAYTISNVLGIATVGIGKLIISVMVGTAVQLLFFFPFAFYVLLFVGFLTFLALNYYRPDVVFGVVDWLFNFVDNVWSYMRGYETILPQHTTPLWIILIGLISIYTLIIVFKAKKIAMLLPVYIGVFIYYWYNYVDAAYIMMIVFFFLYILLYGMEKYLFASQSWREENATVIDEIFQPWIKISMSYGLLIIMIASFLPKGDSLIQWYWLEDKVAQHFPAISDLRNDIMYSRGMAQGQLFDFSQTGFQDQPGQLGGPVELKDQLVMKVKAPQPMYLRGNVKTLYQDNNWWFGEREELLFSNILPREVFLGKEVSIEITNLNFASYTLFSPYQPIEVSIDNRSKMWIDRNYQITLQGARYKNESYKVKAIIPTTDIEIGHENIRASNIHSQFLQIPEDFPTSISDLAQRITRSGQTPHQKALLLEDFLRNNFTYSLEVPHTPLNKDFIEYFLFQSKEGYCTYFASSMAMMLRTLEIPSRYIEGFRMFETTEDGYYEVRQRNAHAWVEAYFDSVGWVTFEPTPAFTPPQQPQADLTALAASGNNSVYVDEMDQLLQQMENSRGEAAYYNPEASWEGNAVTSEDPDIGIWNKLKHLLPIIIIILLFGILPIRAAYMYFSINKYIEKLKNKDTKGIYLYKNILELIKVLGYPIGTGETPSEYARRVNVNVYVPKQDLREISNLYLSAKYSNTDLDEIDKQKIMEYFIYIDKKTRYQLGYWRYLYIKYVKGSLFTIYY